MRLRLVVPTAVLATSSLHPSSAWAQGRIIDEGTFVVTRAGATQTENFRIARTETGLVRATATVVSGTQKIQSKLAVDSLGLPVQYEVTVWDKGAKSQSVNAAGAGSRLVAKTNDQHGDESMHEYPLSQGQTVVVDDGLVHSLFFATFGRHPGAVQVIDPRSSRVSAGTLNALGLEPVEVGGKSVTGTHYSLVSGGVRRDFWIDASGRLLRVEVPSAQLVAAREELPR